MGMHPLDWAIVAAYVLFAVWVGARFRRRASTDVDEFFLSGRRLPWWLAGTSMVATSFAADTPLVVTGWVRDGGIWRNWLWWCFAISGMLTVFGFSRWWRRGQVMTKAELVELRYGDAGARALRGFLGVMHASVTNTITICWVLLAAAKIGDVLFGIDKVVGLTLACVITLSYSLLAGFWGVVVTDLVQLTMAFTGAIALAVISWGAVGGHAGVLEAATATGSSFTGETLRLFPQPGEGAFWTYPLAAFFVYLTVSWWAVEEVDGSGTTVQRISASRDERQGMLAVLWYNVLHFSFRPWPWIAVALASLVVLPHVEVKAQGAGTVSAVTSEAVHIDTDGGGTVELALAMPVEEEAAPPADWRPLAVVSPGQRVEAGELVARTDSERAYVVMMRRYLPLGLLGIAVASLIAALMSTIDTHVNLASSFFVNDFYRRFLVRDGDPTHYVAVARIASAVVLALGALFAAQADSISDLFLFLLAFFSGVGPIYILRWLWWRVRAVTEITAMISSAAATVFLTKASIDWPATVLTPAAELAPEGRLLLAVAFSLVCSMLSIIVTRAPDPASLVAFYRRVRPIGWWGPVRALAPDVRASDSAATVVVGTLGGIACVYGTMLAVGWTLLGRSIQAGVALLCALLGAFCVMRCLSFKNPTAPPPS